MDLYRVLGVDREASPEEIKRGYRRMAKAVHPDMPEGSTERFALVKLAYDVLGDELRRARYDRDGVVEDKPVDNAWAQAVNLIAGFFDQVVSSDPANASRRDVLQVVRGLLDQRVQQLYGLKAQLETQRGQWTLLKGRITRKSEGPNLLAGMVSAKLSAIESALGQTADHLRQCKAAQQMLLDYEFRSDRAASALRPVLPGGQWTTGNFGFGGRAW